MNNRTLPNDNSILLESGTNEVEVLVFKVGELTLGINVAKVREVLRVPKSTTLPAAHNSIAGCFRLRDEVVPCVSLHRHLGEALQCRAEEAVVILTEFNQHQIGFVVDVVERIHRISWTQVLAVPDIISSSKSPVTAISHIDERLVIMLDFEMIAEQVAQRERALPKTDSPSDFQREAIRVAIADDSPTARSALEGVLRGSGYTNLTVFKNGAEVWDWMTARFQATGSAGQVADIVISDVEMPQIDGLHLTRRIKEHAQLKAIPVLLYSSILTPSNFKKGEAVGADAQITKPEIHRVVEFVDKLIRGARVDPQANHANSSRPTAGRSKGASTDNFSETRPNSASGRVAALARS